MAKNLKKFVNPSFTRTVPLDMMRRLLERHRDELIGFDVCIFDDEPDEARRAVERFLALSEEAYPPGLVADLHRIAELGDQAGLEILCLHARRRGVTLTAPQEFSNGRDDPKHVALWTFLEQPDVFDAAANVIAYYHKAGVAEFASEETGVEAQLDEDAITLFESAAKRLFETDRLGHFCEVEWYEDGGEITLVVAFGSHFTSMPVIEEQHQRVINFRGARYAHLSYSSVDGRLKLTGVPMARRSDIAESFATSMLGRPGFFAGPEAQRLYTLAPVQRDWESFQLKRDFDPAIRSARIVEAQVEHLSLDLFGNACIVEGSLMARSGQQCAVKRLRDMCPAIEFTTGAWRLSQIVIRVKIDTGLARPASVTVRLRPHADAAFKRQRFESQIMELLRRNGFCHVQDTHRSAVAAE